MDADHQTSDCDSEDYVYKEGDYDSSAEWDEYEGKLFGAPWHSCKMFAKVPGIVWASGSRGPGYLSLHSSHTGFSTFSTGTIGRSFTIGLATKAKRDRTSLVTFGGHAMMGMRGQTVTISTSTYSRSGRNFFVPSGTT